MVAMFLSGTCTAKDNRIHELKVRGVRDERDRNASMVSCLNAELITLVILHITGIATGSSAARTWHEVLFALDELREHLPVRFFQDMCQDIESPTMGHSNNNFEVTGQGCALNNTLQDWNQHVDAFNGKALFTLKWLGLVEKLLECVNFGNALKQPRTVIVCNRSKIAA